jgi:small subunit ribosomal protein S17e
LDRVRRISEELLSTHHDAFGTDFGKNKELLEQIAIVRSKMLKNRIAGYITKMRVKEQMEQEEEGGEASEEEPQ